MTNETTELIVSTLASESFKYLQESIMRMTEKEVGARIVHAFN